MSNNKKENTVQPQVLNSFEKSLKAKLQQEPRSSMDQLFYQQLEALPEKASAMSWSMRLKAMLTIQNVVPGFASAAVCLVLIVSVLRLERPEFAANGDGYSQIIQMEEALENMELMSELEEIPTSEEDWAILLGDTPVAPESDEASMQEEST
jgi:hypothetical protein